MNSYLEQWIVGQWQLATALNSSESWSRLIDRLDTAARITVLDQVEASSEFSFLGYIALERWQEVQA
jgi:hypothetical protein